jgi:CAP-Gly domain
LLGGVTDIALAQHTNVHLNCYACAANHHYTQPARPTTAPTAGAAAATATAATTASSSAHAGQITEGSRVVITKTGHRGVVKYIGSMKQAEGEFIGVELDLGAGLNDGSVMGRKVSLFSSYTDSIFTSTCSAVRKMLVRLQYSLYIRLK